MKPLDRRTFLLAAAVGPMAVARRTDSPTPSAPPVSALPGPAANTVRMIGRDSWGALAPEGRMRRHTPRRLTLHHSGVRLTRAGDAPDHVRTHQRWHMIEKGHADIDYHYVIDRRGTIYEGRDPTLRGDTQTEYDPTGHLLVCCEGDYEGATGPAQRPTAAMLRSVALVFAANAQRFAIDPSSLAGHRDFSEQTTCPGKRLEREVRDGRLAELVAAAMTSPVTLRPYPSARGQRIVRRIETGR